MYKDVRKIIVLDYKNFCVKGVESYMHFHGLNELPDYSIKFKQCFIE